MKLREQYRRLHAFLADKAQQPGLPALAAALHCSERNMRNLLSRMQQQGWLEWQAGRGRGHHSKLSLLQNPEALALDHLSGLLAKGELEQAFASLGETQRQQLAARLPDYLGVADSACKSLRMPLFRTVASLDPLCVYSRLEAHLARQIFSRLTTFDHETQTLRPALSHHWEQQQNGRLWHFWLRPGLSFHDGSALTVEDVRASMLRLRDQSGPYQNLYRHLLQIETGPGQRISFHLARADHLWPHCLATANASIVPRRRSADFGRFPVGCGAFRLVRNNPYQITLQAFKDYYRERALLDEIDLWLLNPPSGAPCFDLQFGYAQPADAAQQRVEGAESGCTYLICNPHSAGLQSAEQRLALADWLAPAGLFARDDPARKAAMGLLAGWKHRVARAGQPPTFRRGQKLRLISGKSPEMLSLAQAVKQRLESASIQVEWRSLSFPELIAREWLDQADLVMTREVMHDDQDFGCFEWFAADSVFRRWMPPGPVAQLDRDLLKIQAQADSGRRSAAYARIGKRLVQEGWLIPISHENQQISIAPHVAGVRMTPFGFVAFNELWLRR